MSYLVGKSEDRFSCDMAHMYFEMEKCELVH